METYLVIFIIALGLGAVGSILLSRYLGRRRRDYAQDDARKIISDAEKESRNKTKEAELQAKDLLFQARVDAEKEERERHRELASLEKRLIHKEESLDKKVDMLDQREIDQSRAGKKLASQERALSEMKSQLTEQVEENKAMLEKVSGFTSEQAKNVLIESMEEEAKHDAAKLIKQIEEETRMEAEKRSKKILSIAITRYAGDYVAERTVSVVPLPSDDMKGRIIGREGRNIRAIEAATGVDLIVDDTPEAVVISCFNPMRREVARLTLDRLISDGRIHPARIEEVVRRVEKEVDDTVKEAGQQAVFDLGIHGLHPEIIKLVGKLKFRTSYSQNQYQHVMEVAYLCGMMASELSMNVKEARRAGLLHDIGKAVDHEVEGPHAEIGADLAKKYGENQAIVQAIGFHHNPEPATILATLTQAADSLSSARPGARRETLETYLKRLEDLEEIALSFKGVEKCFAIQAGRELRIMAEADSISDEAATVLSKDIARKIEKEMAYPGQIKVTVIRETRAVDYAK